MCANETPRETAEAGCSTDARADADATIPRDEEKAHDDTPHARTGKDETMTVRKGAGEGTIMILPQVHLRKPCYDFSFL